MFEMLQLNNDKPLASGFYIYKMEPGAATVRTNTQVARNS